MCVSLLVSRTDFASAKLSLNIKMHARVLSSKQLFTSLLSLDCPLTAVGEAVLLKQVPDNLSLVTCHLTAVGGTVLLQQVPDNSRRASADIHRNTHL